MNWVWEQSPVKGNERLLLLAIADCASDDGTNAYPSKQKLKDKTKLDLSTIRRIVKRLEQQGQLVVYRSDQRGRANVYDVVMTSPDQAVDNSADAVDKDVDNFPEVGAQRPPGKLPPRQEGPPGEANRAPGRGTAPPQPSRTIKNPLAEADTDITPAPVESRQIDPVSAAVLSQLGPSWHLSDQDRRRLAQLIVEKVADGWPVNGLAAYLSANPKGVVSAVAVLTSRLQELPEPKRNPSISMPKPEWCGECDPISRQRINEDDTVCRCPNCHPLRHEPINAWP